MKDDLYPEAVKIGQKRIHIQYGGPSPINPVKYHGTDTQYLAFTGTTKPVRGGVTPINLQHPAISSEFVSVGESFEAAELPSATLEVVERRGSLPFTLGDMRQPFNVYLLSGVCTDITSFDLGYEDVLEVWSYGRAISVDGGDRSSFESDEKIMDSVELTFKRAYATGKLSWGEKGATDVTTEVLDLVWGGRATCGECGPQADWLYAITKSTGAAAGKVVYSVDKGLTTASMVVTGMGISEDACSIDIVGQYLVVTSPTAGAATQGGYYYSQINQDTGVPSTSWVEVNTGFVAGFEPRDVFVLNQREIFFVCDAGHILKCTDLASGPTTIDAANATTQDYKRIDGRGDVLVATAMGGKVVKSVNRGQTWAATTTDPSANAIQAVSVNGPKNYWVGDSLGGVFYTINGGQTWVTKGMNETLVGIHDIVFVTPEIGYILATVTGPLSRVFSTCNGGYTWISGISSRMANAPSHQRPNRIASPITGVENAVNTAAIGGLGAAADGILLVGQVGIL